MRSVGSIVLLALLAVSCGSGGGRGAEAGSRAAVERLRLAPAGGAGGAPDAGPRLVREDLAASAGWHLAAGDGGLEGSADATEGSPRLAVRGRGRPRIDVPGPFAPEALDLVELELALPRSGSVQVVLRADRRVVLRSPALVVRAGPEPRRVRFELPRRRSGAADVEALSVLGPAGGLDLFAVRFFHRPITGRLPSPAGAAGLVDVGGERRRAWGLSSDGALETTFEAGAGARLAFAVADPEPVQQPGERKTLVLTLAAGAGDRTDRRTFPVGGESGQGWHHEVVELESGSGSVTARFELLVEGAERDACALAVPAVERGVDDPPTVLFVTSDTHRADHLGAVDARISTPNLDALAARGVRFARCSATSNLTLPSHVALMTGTSPRDTGIVTNHQPLADGADTLAEHFRDAGYLTVCAVSAAKLDDPRSGLGPGFDRSVAPRDAQVDARLTVAGLERILEGSADLPLFAWLHVFDAHSPYEPPARFGALYWSGERDPGAATGDRAIPEGRVDWAPEVRDRGYLEALYKGEVSYVDDVLGRVLAGSRFERGLVVVTADHGESFGGHGAWFRHSVLYPSTPDVPLIVAWPGAPAGSVVERVVTHTDLGRTVLDLAGLEGGAFPGTNLFADDAAPRPVFALSTDGDSAAVRHDGWFLLLHLTGRAGLERRHRAELYELARDPGCERDVAGAEHERARALRRALVEWLARARTERWSIEADAHDAAELAQLAELGYGSEARVAPSTWFDPECDCVACEDADG